MVDVAPARFTPMFFAPTVQHLTRTQTSQATVPIGFWQS